MAIQIILALFLGVIILLLSLIKLWNPSENCMQHELRLPFGISFKGCSIWGVVLMIVVFIFYIGFEAANKDAADSAPLRSSASFSVIPSAYAEEGFCVENSRGWVYMGDKTYNDQWWFTKEEGDVGEADGPVDGELVMTANSDRYLREEAFQSLTDTTLGKILGIYTPQVVCIIQAGSQVQVSEFKQTGRDRAWAKAVIKSPPAL